jgi:tetratricopeptide (TPR) repeat protein
MFARCIVLLCLCPFVLSCATSRNRLYLQPDRECLRQRPDPARLAALDHNSDRAELECALYHLREGGGLEDTVQAARMCLLLAQLESDSGRRQQLATEGIGWAEQARRLAADDARGHYYYALNVGLAMRQRLSAAAKYIKELKAALEQAVRLDADLDEGGPLRVLGMLYLLAPAWPQGIGDEEKALELLKNAVERHPRHPLNHIFYARALLETDDEKGPRRARKHLRQAAELLTLPAWRGVCRDWSKEMAKVAEDAEIEKPAVPCP